MGIGLSKKILNRKVLNHEKFKWIQSLEYENTTFSCCIYHHTGQKQQSCPQATSRPRRKKRHYFPSQDQ